MNKPDFVWHIRILGLLMLALLALLLAGLFVDTAIESGDRSGSRIVQSDSATSTGPISRRRDDSARIVREDRRQSAATGLPLDRPGPNAAADSPAESNPLPPDPGEARFDRDGEDDPDEESELEIAGTVFDDRGELVAGVGILARQPGAQTGQIRAQSDRLGMFRLRNLRQGDYELTIAASDDYHALSQRFRAGTNGAELHLQRRLNGRVEGTVRNRQGQPVADVVVRSLGDQGRVRSGALGDYAIEIEWKKVGSSPVLSFEHPDYRVLRQRIPAPAQSGSAITVHVLLEPTSEPVEVAGQVNDRRGQPIAAAQVWLSASQPRVFRRVNADAFGRFLFEGVEPGQDYRLGVDARSPHVGAVVGPFGFGPGDGWVEIVVDRDERGSLSGRVVNPDGYPVAGMGLWLRRLGSSSAPGQNLRSDNAGLFHASGVPAGELWLESMALPYLGVHGLLLQPGEHRELMLPVDWGQAWLFGQVLSADSRPVAGARVSLHWNQAYGELMSVSRRETRTDSEGYFSFANLGAPVYGLQVQAAGYSPWRQPASPGLSELLVVLASAEGHAH